MIIWHLNNLLEWLGFLGYVGDMPGREYCVDGTALAHEFWPHI